MGRALLGKFLGLEDRMQVQAVVPRSPMDPVQEMGRALLGLHLGLEGRMQVQVVGPRSPIGPVQERIAALLQVQLQFQVLLRAWHFHDLG